MTPSLPQTEAEHRRFWAFVERRDGECWPWLGSKDETGRGRFRLRGKNVNAPRVAWAIANGCEPDKFVCHHCDNPSCCNPEHLWLGTQLDNMRDASRKGRCTPSVCKRGHPMVEGNLYHSRTTGARQCRSCNFLRTQQYRNQKRGI